MSARFSFAAAALVAHAGALGEEQRNAPLGGLGHAFDQGPVDFLGAARTEGRAEFGRDLARLGDKQHAGSVAVEPMHQHRPLALFVGERGEHAVDVALGARAALHRQAIGLVEHDQVAVLEQDHRAQRFGVARVGGALLRRGRLRQAERGHAHALTRFEPGRDLRPLAGDAHFALAHDLVEMGLRQVGESPAEPAVEPHAGLVLADRVIGDFACRAHAVPRAGENSAGSKRRPSARPNPAPGKRKRKSCMKRL